MTLTLMCSTVVQYVICATTIYVLSGIHTGVFTVQYLAEKPDIYRWI